MKLGKKWICFYMAFCAGFLVFIYWGNQVIAVISENIPPERKHCIIIDAGHGGIDGGATSCTGVLESALNLEIALRLDDLLHLLGYDTRMIRNTDISVYTQGNSIAQKKISDLKERVRIVNETHGAVLMSIHQNHFSDNRYSGAQVFYPNTPGSEDLAIQLQTALKNTLNPDSRRTVKKSDGIYLMEHINCTGVLIECGFLSNIQEEARLRSKEYQQNLCCVIAATLLQFLSNT